MYCWRRGKKEEEEEEEEMQGTQREIESPEIITIGKTDVSDMMLQVHDSSLDYKGKVPLRRSTGSWRAAFFIIAIEFSERLSYFGIATNLMTYMTKVMKQGLETATNNVSLWIGVTTITPLLGAFLGDAYIDRFSMILFSTIVYVLGLALLTMTQVIPSLKPCGTAIMDSSCEQTSKVHEVMFFTAIYLVSVASGGYKPCLESFGADQFDDHHSEERKQKSSFFNWWNVVICAGVLFAVTLIVYLQEFVGWGIGFLVLSVTMALSVFVFVLGRPFYRYRAPKGSPFTPLLQVFIAALAKRNLPYPSDPSLLYEVPMSKDYQGHHRMLFHTNRLRFLDKAAIVEEDDNTLNVKKQSPWRLATVTQVEELKLLLNTIPIWLSFLVFGIGIAQGSTFFVRQARTTNRIVKLNHKHHFEIPPASIYILAAIGMMSTVAIYDKILLPYLRRATGNERGITILKRIGIGMFFLITGMVVSALVEGKRLKASRDGMTMNVLWLAPQFLIMGIGDGFSIVGMQEYFYEQVPDSMRSLGMAFYLSALGVGSFLASFLIIIVDFVTGKNGGKRWIGKDLNQSRVDYFYWLLAVICSLNLCCFVVLAKNYSYKNGKVSGFVGDSYEYGADNGEK